MQVSKTGLAAGMLVASWGAPEAGRQLLELWAFSYHHPEAALATPWTEELGLGVQPCSFAHNAGRLHLMMSSPLGTSLGSPPNPTETLGPVPAISQPAAMLRSGLMHFLSP